MSARKYLTKLGLYLSLSFGGGEVSEMVLDYQGFIDQEVSGGKNVQEALADLGPAWDLASRLRRESSLPLVRRLNIIKIVVFIACVFLAKKNFWYLFRPGIISLSFMGISFVGMWFLLGGSLIKGPGVFTLGLENHKKLILDHQIIFGLMLSQIALHYFNVHLFYSDYLNHLNPIKYSLYAGVILFILLSVISVFRNLTQGAVFFSAVVHALGGLYSVITLWRTYASYTGGLVLLWYHVGISFTPYILGAVLAFISGFVCKKMDTKADFR